MQLSLHSKQRVARHSDSSTTTGMLIANFLSNIIFGLANFCETLQYPTTEDPFLSTTNVLGPVEVAVKDDRRTSGKPLRNLSPYRGRFLFVKVCLN